MDKFPRKRSLCLLGMILGTMACYIVGTVWLAYQMEMSFGSALMVGVVPFLVGDAMKIFVAVWCGPKIGKQIFKAGYRR